MANASFLGTSYLEVIKPPTHPTAMEFHQLRYFVTAAEMSSISRAAERVRVSQPALSRQIKLLEEELGILLFERVRQRIRVTSAGMAFLSKAKQILSDTEDAARHMREHFGGIRRVWNLGFISPILDDLVAPAIVEFRKQVAGASVNLVDLPPRALLDRMRKGSLDFALLGNLNDNEHRLFQIQRRCKSRMAALLPNEHRLAGRRSLKLSELRNEDWVSLSDVHFPGRRAFFEKVCRNSGFDPKKITETDSVPLLLASVAMGEGLGILPLHAEKLPHKGCAFVRLASPEVLTELFLLSQKKEKSPDAATLVAALKTSAACLERDERGGT